MNLRKPLCITGLKIRELGIFKIIFILFLFSMAFLPMVIFFASAFRELIKSFPNTIFTGFSEKLDPLKNSIVISVFTASLSLVVGAVLAFIFSRTNLYFGKIMKLLCFTPFLIPPYIQAYAWLLLLGKKGHLNLWVMNIFSLNHPMFTIYGIKGVIFVLTLCYFPVVMFLTSVGLESWNPTLEEAASLSLSKIKIIRSISFPLILPYLISAWMLTFIFSLSQFSVPALLEVRTYSVDLFGQISSFFDMPKVAMHSLPLFAISVLLTAFLYKNVEKGYFHVSLFKIANKIRLRTFGQLSGLTISLIVILLSVVFPLGELVYQSKGLNILIKAIESSKDAIVFSVLIAFISASLVSITGYTLISQIKYSRIDLPVKIACLSLLMIPGTIMGISMILLWNHKLSEFIYSSFMILVISYIALFIPYAIFILSANQKQLDKNLQEAASLSKAGNFRIFRYILFPLFKSGLVLSWTLIFILCLGELTTTILVIPPGYETISLRIFSLIHYGESSLVAATSLIPILILILFSFFSYVINYWGRHANNRNY